MTVSAKVAEAYVDLVARTAQFTKAMEDANLLTKKFARETESNMEEAKGSIALLGDVIGVRLPRHLRTFVAELPGVAKALSAAFTGVAVLALAGVIVETGKKIYEFVQKNEEAAKANAKAWRELDEPIHHFVAQLADSNAQISASIARLEKKPANAMADALRETALEASKLADELKKDSDKFDEVIEKGKTTWFDRLKGQAPTDTIASRLTGYRKRIDETKEDYGGVLDRAKESGNTENFNRVQQEMINALQKIYSEQSAWGEPLLQKLRSAQEDHQGYSGYKYGPDQQKGINMLSSTLDMSEDEQKAIGGSYALGQDRAKEAGLQAQKAAADAAKKAAADRLRAIETAFEQEKALYGMSLIQEEQYWHSKLGSFTKGSSEYLAVLSKFGTASAAEAKYLSGVSKSYEERTGTPPVNDSTRGNDQYQKSLEQSAKQSAALTASLDEMRIKLQLSTGAIGPQDAAIMTARVHAQEYAEQLGALNKQLEALKAHQLDGDTETLAKTKDVQNQIDEVSGKARIQQIVDAQSEINTTWKGMISSVFDELIQKAQDTQGQLKQIASSFLNGINGELAKSMTGGKTNFSQLFRNTSEQLSKSALEKIEGLGAKALGFGGGKRDGSSAASALYVQMAGGAGVPGIDKLFPPMNPNVSGPGGAVAGGVSKGLLGMLNDSNWASSLFGGKLFGMGSIFGGGHALGGSVMAGVPIDVGELGRERFVPQVPGRIVPHNQLGGGTTMHIDARGTDPALTRENFQRALVATHAQAVKDAGKATAERNRRVAH